LSQFRHHHRRRHLEHQYLIMTKNQRLVNCFVSSATDRVSEHCLKKLELFGNLTAFKDIDQNSTKCPEIVSEKNSVGERGLYFVRPTFSLVY